MPNKIGGMATIPARESTLQEVLNTISPQLDELYLYLNEYKQIPKFLANFSNVHPLLGKDLFGDLNANGKMYFLQHVTNPSYCFTLDDDILFPSNYVTYMVETLDKFNRQVALSAHGSIFPSSSSWYYERHIVYMTTCQNDVHKAINLAGSGCFVFYGPSMPLSFELFKGDVYVDLSLSLTALENNLPLLAVKKPENWIKIIKYTGLWQKFLKGLTCHTTVMQTRTAWEMSNLRNVWRLFLERNAKNDFLSYIHANHLDPNILSFVSGDSPFGWEQISLNKLKSSIELIY